jgi:TonB family protein
MGQTADLSIEGFARWGSANSRERNFWIALVCAVLFHAAFFISAIRSEPTRLGDPSGAEKAISVSLVTEADLKSRSTVADMPSPPPAPTPVPAQPPAPKPEPPKPEAKQQPQPEPPPPQPEAKPEPQPEKPAEQQAKLEKPDVEENAPDLFSLDTQNPANLKSDTKPKKKPDASPKKESVSKPPPKKPNKPRKRLSSLDLSPPPSASPPSSFDGGPSAAFRRPPGITRSGLNDEFAREVIRALQRTMPQLSGVLGRVTVRIYLSESGNVEEVRLLKSSSDHSLDQDVIFAARQTSYPIPPAGSNVADRTFMVTYVYD